MIEKPVKLDSATDAYFIRDANGKIVVDNMTDGSIAAEIVRSLNDVSRLDKQLQQAHEKIRQLMNSN